MEPKWLYRTLSDFDFIKQNWVEWMFLHPLQVFLWSLGCLVFFHGMKHVSDGLGLFLFGRYRKVVFTYDAIKIRHFLFYRTYKREDGVSFEVLKHPKANTNPSGKVEFDREYFEKTGIVLMRCGFRRPVKVAVMYDTIPFNLGHRSQEIVDVLQRLLKDPIAPVVKDKPHGKQALKKF